MLNRHVSLARVIACAGGLAGLAACDGSGRAAGPPVILVVIDTLRADVLRCYGHSGGITPALDAFADEAFVFERALSGSSWTRPAVASLLTSRWPAEHGILSESLSHGLAPGFITLPERLRERGYRTAAITTNPNLHFGLHDGIDNVEYELDRSAEAVYAAAAAFAERHRDDSFFLWVHNNDPHDPYQHREGFSTTRPDSDMRSLGAFLPVWSDGSRVGFDSPANRSRTVRLPPARLQELRANYEGEIRYVDHHLGRFLARLRELGLLEQAIVMVTSDHGEEFLERGSYGHGGTLHAELVHVPLLLRAPGIGRGRIAQAVSTVDVAPTLLELAGVDWDARPPSGRSLVPLLRGESLPEAPIFSATAFRGREKQMVVSGGYKLIRYADGAVIGLYEVVGDPGERDDLSQRDPARVRELAALLDAHLARSRGGSQVVESPPVDAATREELRSLGYVAD